MEAELQDGIGERGWAVVRGVLGPARVGQLRRAFDQHLAPSRLGPEQVWQLPGVGALDPTLAAWVLGPEVLRLAVAALSCAAPRLVQDALLLKTAGCVGRVEWHQDHAYIAARRSVSVRLALTRNDRSCGGLAVLDGSHRWPTAAVREPTIRPGALERLPAELRARVEATLTAVDLGPGDVSVHLGATWHASFENPSLGPSRVIVVHAFDPAAGFDRVGPPEQSAPAELSSFPLLGARATEGR